VFRPVQHIFRWTGFFLCTDSTSQRSKTQSPFI